MIMSEVEETVTTLELDEETFEEIYRVRIEVIFITVIYWEIFAKIAISIILQKNFLLIIHVGNIKGMAWQYFRKICENEVTQKFPSI